MPAKPAELLAVYDNGDRDKAQNLANTLQAPLLTVLPETGYRFVLRVSEDELSLQRCTSQRENPIVIDFQKAADASSKNDPLLRAMGKKCKTVIDATAGFGADSALLAFHDFQVTAIERSAVVYAMLNDALNLQRFVGVNFKVIHGDSLRLLRLRQLRPDAVYLDPMYPPRRKSSALPRKEMAVLRELVGGDADAAELLQVAQRCARHRVVVKRPPDAQPLIENPSFIIESKLLRFDVYLTP